MIKHKIARFISSKVIASIENNIAFDLTQVGYKKRLELQPRKFTFIRDFNKIEEMVNSLETIYAYLDSSSSDPQKAAIDLCIHTESSIAFQMIKFKEKLKEINEQVSIFNPGETKIKQNLKVIQVWKERQLWAERVLNPTVQEIEHKIKRKKIFFSLKNGEKMDANSKDLEYRWKKSELYEYPEISYGLRIKNKMNSLGFEIQPNDRECALVLLETEKRIFFSPEIEKRLETQQSATNKQGKCMTHLLRFEKVLDNQNPTFMLVDIDDYMKKRKPTLYVDFRDF